MTDEEYLFWSQTEEGKAFLETYIVNGGAGSNTGLMNIDVTEEKTETVLEEDEDARKSKRSIESEVLNGDMTIDQRGMSSHTNPIFLREMTMSDGTDSMGNLSNGLDKQMLHPGNQVSERAKMAIDSFGNHTGGGATMNQHGMAANQSKGYENKFTRYHLSDLIKSNDPDLVFLAETKNQDKKMLKYIQNLGFLNYCYVNPVGASGGIFLLWKDGISLDIVDANSNFIVCHTQINARSDKSLIILMYGALSQEGINNQWEFLYRLASGFDCPWAVVGDLNFITSREDKLGGNIPSQSDLDFVNDHLNNLNLSDVNYIGNPYTWTNRRNFPNLILERLDRAMCNEKWFSFFPNSVVYHLVPHASDHCPILLVDRERARENIISCDTGVWKRRTQIETIQSDTGVWITDRKCIASELRNHFSAVNRSTNPPCSDDFLCDIVPCITNDENDMLTKIPTSEEISNILFQMQPWTTPGPDGYPPGFYQKMCLIPKNNGPKTPHDFRPISLSNVAYKIISELLANRLKKVMDKFISPYQAAFLTSKQITDNIVIAHELVGTMKKCKARKGLMAVKLDMSTGFDRIEWGFLINILKKLGFHKDWCDMIFECISTVSASVLLNGSPGEVFYPSRGLRQGDPLSPYLFIIVMDCFSRLMVKAEHAGVLQGIKVPTSSPAISHLFFADDCLIFAKANLQGARTLDSIIKNFSKYSGQSINFGKSGMAFSSKMDSQVKNQIATK
ncbi:uncharacterized protein LOC113331882 [Papaver somniferum]|uniref:uncharacterized protein LOC113331882 n=1 Tax=Papaver somniferum TaxID=3469 RepID=UPI000E70606E|nr:uncharacterized protein LOC113331882 [Papaver somniferum]